MLLGRAEPPLAKSSHPDFSGAYRSHRSVIVQVPEETGNLHTSRGQAEGKREGGLARPLTPTAGLKGEKRERIGR